MNEGLSVNYTIDGQHCVYVCPTPEGTVDITTPRLDLRRFKERDAEAVFEWSQDELHLAYFQCTPLVNVDEARTVIGSWRTQYANNDFLVWCIQEAATRTAIGKISASLDIEGSCAEVEYFIGSRHRRQGFAAEALEHVIAYLHEIGIHRVQAKINTRNIASTHVVEKAGMELEGICRDLLTDRHGIFYDVAIFAHISEK